MQTINVFYPPPGTFDLQAGIHIAALACCGALTFYLTDIPPHGSVNAHSHRQGDEIYLILNGEGCLYSQAQGTATLSTPLRAGDLLRIPSGHAHQLVNLGEQPLRLLFVCPNSHLSHDRIMHPNLRDPIP
ncbi:cupin domain-containing protein [Paludibacterium purpuratum]|uniref:Cupin domain n=1 Tax=Paludibacterium purpuratum TaxID=1144873 RepID=A0A4R7B1H4_9NEIS|nr:cupin domain-containing protein [Paludibacterium purpuratum]TDR73622.1 cupin domain [Paludibacterium purpuratum]